jgi:hypothetical protein
MFRNYFFFFRNIFLYSYYNNVAKNYVCVNHFLTSMRGTATLIALVCKLPAGMKSSSLHTRCINKLLHYKVYTLF